MACKKYILTNNTASVQTFTYQECSNNMWIYDALLEPGQTKTIWFVNPTFQSYYTDSITITDEGAFPPTPSPSAMSPSPTPTPSITPSVTPTRTVTPTVTPSVTITQTPTSSVTPSVTPTISAPMGYYVYRNCNTLVYLIQTSPGPSIVPGQTFSNPSAPSFNDCWSFEFYSATYPTLSPKASYAFLSGNNFTNVGTTIYSDCASCNSSSG